MSDQPIRGNKEERKSFEEVYRHYEMAKEDLESRFSDWDKKDVLFRSHIEESTWPYRAQVFDPRIFTVLYEKTARTFANKPQGRLIPREGGDALGAMINNELLSFQWDDNERADGESMLAKWARMDLNARKYGASFAVCKWKYQTQSKNEIGKRSTSVFYDGPDFKPCNNKDVLHNPSYSTIKNWIQLRDYNTLQEMSSVNDSARTKPVYKNLDLLKDAINAERRGFSGDSRNSDYSIKNLTIKNLQDYLGKDEYHKVIEVVTEYRPDRWITFAPKHGVILRDIPNPYLHGQIPVVLLKYYPIDEDIYGLSEIEPVEKLQRAINALVCQYLDSVNISTYPILKVRSTGGAVQMHTLEFGPGKKWLMSDPNTDVVSHQFPVSGVQEFGTTYRFLVGALQEALGETSAATSNMVPGSSNKTATEIKDLSVSRNVRDNFNSIFLGEAMKKQMMLWHKMNQQYIFDDPKFQQKVLRITSKDAIKYFQQMGLDAYGLTDQTINYLSDPNIAAAQPDLKAFEEPLYGINTKEGTIPKMVMEEDGQSSSLILEPEDLSGNYDYIPDMQTMRLPDEAQLITAGKQIVELALNPVTQQNLMQEGYTIKTKEILEDYFTKLGVKDTEKYFQKSQMQGGLQNGQIDPNTGQLIQTGAGGAPAGGANMVNGGVGGMAGNLPALPPGAAQPVVPGPGPV